MFIARPRSGERAGRGRDSRDFSVVLKGCEPGKQPLAGLATAATLASSHRGLFRAIFPTSRVMMSRSLIAQHPTFQGLSSVILALPG